MKTATTKKSAKTKLVSFVNLSLAIIMNNYAAIKDSYKSLLQLLISDLDFINLNPQLNYLKNCLSNIHLHLYYSKNKKCILVQLESNAKNYQKLEGSIWSKFSKEFFKENKKDNTGYFQTAFRLYQSEKKSNQKFLMELLIVRNNCTKKDFSEIKSNMFNSASVEIAFNKNNVYVNDYNLPYMHLNSVDFDLLENLSNRSKSYLNKYFCSFLKTIAYSLLEIRNDENKQSIKKEIKKTAKKKIAGSKRAIHVNNKLQKISKKLNRKNNKKK